jgi:hypothetical protein
MQLFMRFHTHHLVAIQQPVQLLTGQRNHITFNFAGPFEARPLQPLLPQTKAVALPVQDLDLCAESNSILHTVLSSLSSSTDGIRYTTSGCRFSGARGAAVVKYYM